MRALRPAASAAALALAISFSFGPAPARAHGQKPHAGQGSIEPVANAAPDALAGVRVQLHDSLAPQIVVENPRAEPLEIVDERGVAFLRLGPGGAEANLAAASWYRTATPSEQVPVPQTVIDAAIAGEALPPRWKKISDEPAWGWFDPRVATEGRRASAAVVNAARRVEVGDWEIPVRFGGTMHRLTGHFVYQPKRVGSLRLRLEGATEIAPGVRISLLPGRNGSFFLRSASPHEVSVLGQDGEPFLRFTPAGVDANRHSITYGEIVRMGGGSESLLLDARSHEPPQWQRVSSSPSHGWLDPRTLVASDVPPEVIAKGSRSRLRRWSLPVRVGSGDDALVVEVKGATFWEPFAVPRQTKADEVH